MKSMPVIQPTYAFGAIRRGVKSRGAFAEVTADGVCALPAVADSGNGAALVDICNRRSSRYLEGMIAAARLQGCRRSAWEAQSQEALVCPELKLPREEPIRADVPQGLPNSRDGAKEANPP